MADLWVLPMILILWPYQYCSTKKKTKKSKNINALEKGDNVKTIGEFLERSGKDDRVVVQIAENVKVEVAKEAVSAKVE